MLKFVHNVKLPINGGSRINAARSQINAGPLQQHRIIIIIIVRLPAIHYT